MTTAPSPTYGDIHNTPFYDTSYQHDFGYNQRHLDDKSQFWNTTYKYHTPSAARIRNRFISKPGRDEVGRTQPRSVEVQEVLQARTALLGSTFDTTTENSLRVEKRYGRAQRPGETQWPIPGSLQSLPPTPFSPKAARPQTAPAAQAAHDSWANRTIPKEHQSTYAVKIGQTGSVQKHYSSGARHEAASIEPWNSRAGGAGGAYETEYVTNYCDAKTNSQLKTSKPQEFFQQSLRSFEDPINYPTDTLYRKPTRPQSPTQPLIERQSNERISTPGLVSMKRPIHRKSYEDLQEYPLHSRPAPYSFDLRDHIERVRPSPLFKDQNASGQRLREGKETPGSLIEINSTQPLSPPPTTFNTRLASR